VDLYKAIRELHEERKRLERIIAFLEKGLAEKKTQAAPKRRGRKSMDAEERKLVSERMRRYWEARRAQSRKDMHNPNDPPTS
jgi:hypothetical protein